MIAVCALLGGTVIFLAYLHAESVTELKDLKQDAIEKGYAEWIVDVRGNVEFKWKENKK